MSPLAETTHARSNTPLSFDKSAELIERNAQWMAGGVNSNFRLNISPTLSTP